MVSKLWTVCIFILVVEIAERLCYYSISGSQRNFLTDIPSKTNPTEAAYSQGSAGAINSVFTMLSYLSCFLGGYLADQWMGRYKAIFVFATVYFVGTVMVAVAANPNVLNIPLYLAGCLVFISLGTGAIKPNVMTFGAAQYDESDPVEKAQQKTFFSYFYLMINVGAGVSYAFLVNIATSDVTRVEIPNVGTVTDPGWGFFKCYIIAAGSMGFAVLSFVAGTCRYKKEAPAVHKPMISVMCKYLCRSASSPRGMMAAIGWVLIPIYIILNLVGSVIPDPKIGLPLVYTCLGLCLLSSGFLIYGHMKNDWMQEFTQEIAGTGVTLVDAKRVFGMVPQLLLLNIGFNIPYNAMNNGYPTLACQMDVRLPWTGSDGHRHQLNGAFCNLGDCFAIIIGIPIIESLIYPMLEKRQGKGISRRSKYICGFLLVCLANGTAILIESIRRTRPFIPGEFGVSQCAPGTLVIHMSDMSCFWAFIPMFLTGIGEILVNPVVYEFAFSEAPSQLLSIVQAFNLVVAGSISNCVTGPMSIAFFPDNLNGNEGLTPIPNKFNDAGDPGNNAQYDVNLTFGLNIAIGLICLVLYMVVEKYDESQPENLSLTKEGGDEPLTSPVEDGH